VLELGAGSWNRADNVSQYTSGSAVGNKTANSVPEEIKSGDYLKYKGQGTAPQIVYDNLHHVFNPKGFDAKEWARLFKAAGAGYIVFTTKHHDGFCNFDTQTQDYDIMNTPFKRDICKELAIACRAEAVRVFWYYSPVDWWHPDWRANADTAYEEKAFLPQMEELLTNYGPIDGIWWDGGQITEKYAKKVHELIQKHQPWALTNGRLGGGFGGDFETPEQKLGEFNIDSRWESCITMTGASWFWNGGKEYKSSNTCLKTLIACAVGDGNLLLDVGPRGDGRIDERAAEIYRSMGAWLKQYGPSIRGTRGGPYKPAPGEDPPVWVIRFISTSPKS
jgi:alpha-L-fucosidase